MANKALIPILVTMMLVTGVCNTILNKYQVRPRFRATKKQETQTNRCISNRICNVCGTAIPQIPASGSCSNSLSFKRRFHLVLMI